MLGSSLRQSSPKIEFDHGLAFLPQKGIRLPFPLVGGASWESVVESIILDLADGEGFYLSCVSVLLQSLP